MSTQGWMAGASKPSNVQIKLPYNMQNQILRLDASRPAFCQPTGVLVDGTH